jgi:hypothetical protein
MDVRMSETEPSPEYVTTIAKWTDVPAAMEALETEAEKAAAKKAAFRKWYVENRERHKANVRAHQAEQFAANPEAVRAASRAKYARMAADARAWQAAKRAAAQAAE